MVDDPADKCHQIPYEKKPKATVDTNRERPEKHFKDKRTLDQFVIGHASLRPARARAAVFASGGDGYIILGGARQRSR